MRLLTLDTETPGSLLQGGGFGALNNKGDFSHPLTTVTGVISKIIGFMTICAALWFLVQLLIGGISWISAGGDKNKLTEARNRITQGVIGLIIVVAAWGIVALIGQLLGWDIMRPDISLIEIK